ncbi:hypothetical protein [Shewanella sp. NFH-SH190041]|uniref:hypothetical protein n=1 Tax=Shewanella sp. NFH-SH190041 TaxID=2950245 RepID=UPI0021C37A34|nr:hypothetical protein [Shewanella sp. NFH-SH190041]
MKIQIDSIEKLSLLHFHFLSGVKKNLCDNTVYIRFEQAKENKLPNYEVELKTGKKIIYNNQTHRPEKRAVFFHRQYQSKEFTPQDISDAFKTSVLGKQS